MYCFDLSPFHFMLELYFLAIYSHFLWQEKWCHILCTLTNHSPAFIWTHDSRIHLELQTLIACTPYFKACIIMIWKLLWLCKHVGHANYKICFIKEKFWLIWRFVCYNHNGQWHSIHATVCMNTVHWNHSYVAIAVLEAISGTIKGHETMCWLDVVCRNILD